MKNNKLIGIILALLVCLSVVVSVSAATESDVVLSLGSTDPKATNEAIGAAVVAPEGTVSYTVSLDKNAGIYCISPSVEYDAEALEYVSSEAAGGIKVTVVKKSDGVLQLIIGDVLAGAQLSGTPSTYTGNVVTLNFKALATETDKSADISLVLEEIDIGTPASVNAAAQTASVKVNVTSAAHECTETITVNDKAATCTEDGATGDVHCAQCGALITASEVIPATDHRFDLEAEGEITKKPDCLNTGIAVYYCLNEGCDMDPETEGAQAQTYEKVLEIAHEAIVPVPEKAATCFEEGNTEGTMCEKCGKTFYETQEKIPHTYDNGVETKAATCTNDGVMTFTCTVEGCGNSYTDVIQAIGHSYVAIEKKDPTCDKSGHTAGSQCSACDVYETEPTVIEALVHNYIVNVTDATCDVDGKEVTTCSRCDYKNEVVLKAQGHKYTIEVTYAGCETEGFTTYTCSECDDQYVDGKVGANGHKYGDYKVVTPATRTEPGKEEATCALCNAVDSREIAPLGGINPVIIVVIVVVVLAGVAVAVYFVLKSKKASKN